MARKEKQESTRPKGIEPPFASSPRRPPRYGFEFRYQGRVEYYNFYAKYAAKKFIEACLQGNDYEWTDGMGTSGECIKDATGLRIEGIGLEEVMNHEYTTAEAEWVLPSPDCHHARDIRLAQRKLDLPKHEASDPTAPKKERKERVPRPSRDGMITIGQIANDLGLDASEARGILRKKKVDKPAGGWAWSTDEAEKIKKMLS